MKRLFILLLAISLFTYPLFSKSIEIVNGDFLVTTSPNTDEIKAHCVFKNVSDQTIDVKLTINLLEATEGLDVAFCWGPICYPPLAVNVPRNPNDVITLPPGAISGENEFYLTFSPNGYEGTAVVEAILYVASNPEDSLHLTFKLTTVLGVEEPSLNPPFECIIVDSKVELEKFGLNNKTVEIYSLNGSLISKSECINLLDVSFLPKGLYLLTQNETRKKLIIIKL